MQFRPASTEAFGIQQIMLGCAPSAGLYHKSVSHEEVQLLLEYSASRGVTTVDTAPWYGCGRSELDIGTATSDEKSGQTLASITIYTKAGRYAVARAEATKDDSTVAWGDQCFSLDRDTTDLVCVHDYTYDGIMKSWEQSKARLGPKLVESKRIVSLRLHDCDDEQRFQQATAVEGHGAVDALKELKARGEVKEISLGMNSAEYILRFLQMYPNTFDNVLMAGCWNPIELSGLPVFVECAKQKIGIHLAGVFGAGLMWGSNNYRYAEAQPDVITKRDALAEICRAHNVTLPSFAIHFASRPTAVSLLVLGAATATEFEGCLKALEAVDPVAVAAAMKDAVQAGLIPLESVPEDARP